MSKDNNEKKEPFQIQIPQKLIRNKNFSNSAFVVYAKMIQFYYLTGKKDIIPFDHRLVMYQLNIRENRRLKRILDELYNRQLIKTKIDTLPRKGNIDIELYDFFNLEKQGKEKEDRYYFAQLPWHVIEYPALNAVGLTGVRLLYYYQSYINISTGKEFAYPAYETIMNDTGLADKTLTKYNRLLEKNKFIKIIKHPLINTYEYITKDTKEVVNYTRFNNHYYVYPDKIIKHHEKTRIKQQNNDDPK